MYIGMKNKKIIYNLYNWLKTNGIKIGNVYIDKRFRKHIFYYFYVTKRQFKLLDKIIDIESPLKCKKLRGVAR